MKKNKAFINEIISEIQIGVDNARKEIRGKGAFIPKQFIKVEISDSEKRMYFIIDI